MGTGGTSENSGQPEADNVIRFPRDWFGSKDDLIPIGPAADRLAEIAAERENALGAADFWGERSGALHQPVDLPPEAEAEAEAPELTDHRGGTVRALHVVPPERQRLTRQRTPRLHVSRAALVLAAMVVAALGIFLSGVLREGPHPAHSVRTITSRSAATRSAPSVAVSQRQLISDSQRALRSAVTPYLIKTTPTRTVQHAARHTKPAARHLTRTHVHTGSKSVTPEVVAAATSAVTTPSVFSQVSGAPVESGKSSLSSSIPSARSSSSASTASSAGSSPTSSGPTGLGQSVGPGCDPQC